MQILLSTLNAKYIHLNLAIRLLFELNKEDRRLSWKEFTIKDAADSIALACSQYQIVAFSCYIWNIRQTLAVCEKIKAINPATQILLGGPEVSYDWQDVIALDYVDYIIYGEGEIPFREFLQHYPKVDLVSGLIHKKNGTVVKNLAPAIFDLQQFENCNPYANEDPTQLYNKVLYIETSRGCPYKCEFCLASLDNKVRYLPNEHIKSNLLYLMQHGRVIKFLDRTFNIKKDFSIDIFKFILANYRPGNVFQFEITADIVHPDIIAFINDHVPKGLFRFEIGIQTVNQQANLEVSRKQNFEKTKSIILQLQDKVDLHLDLIVGLPLDYWADIKYSFEEVFKLFAPELQLGFLKFLKGTPVRDKYREHDYEFDPQAPYQIIRSKYLSEYELQQITLLEHALEIYWNKKRCLNTLKYATTHLGIFDFLLGLGNYFGQKSSFHQFTLEQVYTIMYAYVSEHYPDDKYLKNLIAVDYYLQHKIKPKHLFIESIGKTAENDLVQQYRLNPHKYRYVYLPIQFSWKNFSESLTISPSNELLIIEYHGTSASKVLLNISPKELPVT